MKTLTEIVAAGIANYQQTKPCGGAGYGLPLWDPALPVTVDAGASIPNITLSESAQIRLCLDCVLPECADLGSRLCPIRVAQAEVWRAKNRARR